MRIHRRLAAAVLAVAVVHPAWAVPERASFDANDAVARLRGNAGGRLLEDGAARSAYAMLRATGTRPLMLDGGAGTPVERAQFFLSVYGAAVGVHEPALELAPQRVSRDAAGNRHVHLDQMHAGLPVYGARLVVHLDARGITGVNGVFVPVHGVATAPALDVGALRRVALADAAKRHPGAPLQVSGGRFVIFPVGLVEGRLRGARLAYEAKLAGGSALRESVFVDARSGAVLFRLDDVHSVRNREIFTPDLSAPPTYVEGSGYPIGPAPTDPPLINDPGHGGSVASTRPANSAPANLYVFAGGTYALYANMFGREGYDACDTDGPCETGAAPAWSPTRGDSSDVAGQLQQSVYLVNDACPNAYWNGVATHYCPGFDADDVVSHEWSHAYTEYTHGLIYAYQSGALNESYSDIFGETYDLVNKLEGSLGASLVEHYYYTGDTQIGSRWVVGEDLSEVAASLLLRDMWRPDEFAGTPGKATSENYSCGASDGGGVHNNSSVPNHAYAMIVDGTAGQGEGTGGSSYNGQSFSGIGIIKAAHIYFHAEANYQTPTTDFPQHANALRASCQDLKGVNLKDPTGALSGQMITDADCEVVNQAMLAVQMDLGTPCPFLPVLLPDAPAVCDGATDVFAEDWESGAADWTRTSTGVNAEWEDSTRATRDFILRSDLPANRAGTAAFALDSLAGTCLAGGDYSGQFTYDSPAFTVPAGLANLKLRFEHYVATEAGFDGGQVEIKVNDAAFALIPPANYEFNAPGTFDDPAPVGNNTSPNAGERGWHGTDINPPSGAPPGSWGTTVVDLTGIAKAGDTVQLRFTFSQDGCNGVDGWYVDNVRVHSCAVLDPPVLTVASDYEDPDTDGSFTLNWTRPSGATGPDLVQKSTTSCAPLFTDNAEAGLANWVTESPDGWTTSTTKKHGGTYAFWGELPKGFSGGPTLTSASAFTVPASGTTTLSYWDWYINESDDVVRIEVSTDDGASWQVIHEASRGVVREEAAPLLATEPMTLRSHDLTPFAGQSIKLRFSVIGGGSVYFFEDPFGWYLDDISITNDDWGDALTATAPSATLADQVDGARCYRVRTAYPVGGELIASRFSNLVTVDVQAALVNLPPLANAGADLAAVPGDVVVLTGAASSDPNGDVLTYAWQQTGGPAVVLQSASTAAPRFTAPAISEQTVLTFELTVSDGTATGSDFVNVTVVPPAATLGGDNRAGGAVAPLALLLLGLAGIRRRRVHTRR